MLKKIVFGVLAAAASMGIAYSASINITGAETRWNRSIFEAGIFRNARDIGATATAGGGQTNAYQITAGSTQVTTVASSGDSVKLPVSTGSVNGGGGLIIFIANGGANSMNVFPETGGQINALGSNAAFALASGKSAIFFCGADGQWYAILTA